jgi:hypothetical protein
MASVSAGPRGESAISGIWGTSEGGRTQRSSRAGSFEAVDAFEEGVGVEGTSEWMAGARMKMAGKGMSGFSNPWKGMLASKLSFWAVRVDVKKNKNKNTKKKNVQREEQTVRIYCRLTSISVPPDVHPLQSPQTLLWLLATSDPILACHQDHPRATSVDRLCRVLKVRLKLGHEAGRVACLIEHDCGFAARDDETVTLLRKREGCRHVGVSSSFMGDSSGTRTCS